MKGRAERWFERIKQRANPDELYALLFALPKGADLHVHLSGCGGPTDWWELAREYAEALGVRTAAASCGHRQDGPVTLRRAAVTALSECCRAAYVPLASLTDPQRQEWAQRLSLMRLRLGSSP